MRRRTQRRPTALGLPILLGVAIVLCCAALAFAAARTTGDTRTSGDARTTSHARTGHTGRTVKAAQAASPDASRSAQGRTATPAAAKPGDITIRGKAGAYTNVDYGPVPRPEHGPGSPNSGDQ